MPQSTLRATPDRTRQRRKAVNPNGSQAALDVDVGSRLRILRTERGLSLRALAEASGLSINTLGLIENEKTSPSVSTLQQVARALELPITAFFETSVPPSKVVHIKAKHRPRVAFEHGTLEDLGAGLANRAVEPILVRLEPFASSGPNSIVHTGYEFVFCLEGRLVYTIQDQTYLLEPGDSLLFESHLPHRWQNIAETPSQSLLVLFPTDARDRPTKQHFGV